MRLEEIDSQLAGETFHPSVSDAFIHDKHYVVLNGDFQPCPLGEACQGFPFCHTGFDYVAYD
jgi:hypothetical protein